MKKVERYINEIIKGKGEYSTTYHHSENSKKYVCPYLTYYNENRDVILDKGGEKRNDLKIDFLKMVNSDFKRTYKDPFMEAFDKELKNFQKQIVGQECYEDIIKCNITVHNHGITVTLPCITVT